MRALCWFLLLVFAGAWACSSTSSTAGKDVAVGDKQGGDTRSADCAGGQCEVSELLQESTGDTTPACGGDEQRLIPGHCEAGFDEELEAKAFRYDRCWRLFNAGEIGLNTDVGISPENVADREALETFIKEHDGWEDEFEQFAGKPPVEVLSSPNKVAGLYGGVGIVADAYRYGVLRDQGYPVEEVERARQHLVSDLEMLHLGVDITGVTGVIARGLALTAWNEKWNIELTPLFDEEGNPLPEEKSNGTWREDNSEGGKYPDYIWEDSVSRDQLIGWVAAFGAAWEVIAEDPDIPQDIKNTLRKDAKDLGHALKVVRESGYDLEVPDADGRTTLHGYLNEHNIDGQFYLPTVENGFHAVMALGIVASYVYCSGDPELHDWLYDELIDQRELPRIADEHVQDLTDFGYGSNFSNYNMAFMGFWLALQYLEDGDARVTLRHALKESLYDRKGRDFQPADIHYSFYDFTYAAGYADTSAFHPSSFDPDEIAIASGIQTLLDFAEPPYWDIEVINCPILEEFQCKQQRADTGSCSWDKTLLDKPCIASDGVTELTPIGCQAWKCTEAVSEALPFKLQRPSNYHWRSAPHEPNGGGNGGSLLPGVDFRFAYWMGRWARK